MENKNFSITKLTIHFIVGFIVYQVIGELLVAFIKKPLLLLIENNIHTNETIWIISVSFICLILIQFIAAFLSLNSLCKRYVIGKNQVKQFLINISLFYIVLAFITTYISIYKDFGMLMYIILSFMNLISMLLTLFYIKHKLKQNNDSNEIINSTISNEQINKTNEGLIIKILGVILIICMVFLIYTWFFKDKKTNIPESKNEEGNVDTPKKEESNSMPKKEETNSTSKKEETNDVSKKPTKETVNTKLVCALENKDENYIQKVNIKFKNNVFYSYESIVTYTYSSRDEYSISKEAYLSSKDAKFDDSNFKITIYSGTGHELSDGSEDEYKKLNLESSKKRAEKYGYTCKKEK